MAQLLAPVAPGSERISQILPTVKCSDCNEPVPISELGSHVCPPAPPVPKLLPAQSPRFVTEFLPNKLRELVTPPTQPNPQLPPRTSAAAQGPSRRNSPAPAPTPPHQPTQRSRALSSASSMSMSSRTSDGRRPSFSSPLARDPRNNTDRVPFPAPPVPSEHPRMPSPGIPTRARMSPGIERAHTPGNIAPPGTTALRPRPPSSASLRPNRFHERGGGSSDAARQPAMSSPSPYLGTRLDPRAASPAMSMAPLNIRQRAGTSASARPSLDPGPEIIYSTDVRARTPVANPAGLRAPSAASMRPALGQMRPSMDQMRPSMDQMRPSMDQMRPSMDQMRRPSGEQQRSPFMGGPLLPARTPPIPISTPPLNSPPIEPDTKTGGEAGMAGVGRRGFAAAARAAMFMSMGPGPMGPPPTSPAPDRNVTAPMMPNQGMDGRRANAPRFLDIASAAKYAANTPPLSPGSGTASMSPHSPLSQQSPGLPGSPSPSSRMSPSVTPTAPAAGIASASPTSPTSDHNLRDRVMSPPQEVPKAPTAEPQTPRLPFFEKFKNKLPTVDTAKAAEVTEPSPPSADSDSSYDGLAYADSDEEDLPLRSSPSPHPIATHAKPTEQPKTMPASEGKVRFPSMTESKYSSSSSSASGSPRLPQRSLSAASSRTVAKSTGALERTMETLFEDSPVSPTASSVSRTLTESQRESVSKSPKLPTRSHTSPTLPRLDQRRSGAVAADKKKTKTKVCVRCVKVIEDGRWIQMEGGGVLCDRCWKNMYLPKCRRCNKTIEKQAVSSSDGQLKGKWHRECFSCFTCQKPFPDKSFYVYDGKPYCAYHYHEENNSLCAAARCGQPIEGPCAVSHAGDRYHPEHFLCEYRGCTERLVEYYELDGRMLCETHVQKARDEDEDEEDDSRDAMAMKRVTRFIDLAALS